MKQRPYLRVQVEVDVSAPITAGFWWVTYKGEYKWASVKYELLSDLCYGCRRLGHTSPNCNAEVAMSELTLEEPLYGPWLLGVRPRSITKTFHLGGQ